ncbi:MAG: RNA polymerase subunit sigma-24, partial [Planctomycetota bacterium]
TEVWNKEHDRHVLLQLLQRVSKQFSEQSLDVFRRVAIMQEDAATVAEEMGIKLGALRVAQHRVMKELRNTAAGLVDLESI